jgi:hypothetical protein
VSVGSPPTLLFLAESIFALARSIFAGNNCDARQINRAPLICMGAVPGRGNCICYFWSERAHADDGSPQIRAAHHTGGVRHFSTIRLFSHVTGIESRSYLCGNFSSPVVNSHLPSLSLCHCRARNYISSTRERESSTHARGMCLP